VQALPRDGRDPHGTLWKRCLCCSGYQMKTVTSNCRDVTGRRHKEEQNHCQLDEGQGKEHARVEEELCLLRTLALAVSEAEDVAAALDVVLRGLCGATGWMMVAVPLLATSPPAGPRFCPAPTLAHHGASNPPLSFPHGACRLDLAPIIA
jgi:hypothetical protein